MFHGVEHVTIASKDPKKLAKWYCNTLGFKIVYESSKSLTTFVKLGESLIEMIEARKVDRVAQGDRDPGLRHVAISVSDIQRAYENLESKGVLLASEPTEKGGVSTVFFRDPDDNLLHLIQRSKFL